MNTNTKTELAAVTTTQSAVDAMAVVTLSPEKYAAEVYQPFKAKLATAIDSVRAIDYDIATTAGMDAAIKCRALFRDMRVAADKERKARKEPITKIGKLLESGFDLVEERIKPLELMFDADIDAENSRKEAEKAAKIAAERARTEVIANAIQAIRDLPLMAVGKSSADISAMIGGLVSREPDESFEEFIDQAKVARHEAMDKLAAMETAQRAIEIEAESQRQEAARQALAAEESRKADAARIEQERATLAAQRAENERIANEQAATAKRLADQEAAQALAAKQLADKAAANLKAERDAQELAMRLEREKAAKEQAERDRVAADTKRQLEAQQAAIEAQRAAFAREQEEARQRAEDAAKIEADHPEALDMNARIDADWREEDHAAALAEDEQRTTDKMDPAHGDALDMQAFRGITGRHTADLARCAATVTSLLIDARTQPAFSDTQIRDSLIAYAESHSDDAEVTDKEIMAIAAELGLTPDAWVERLTAFCERMTSVTATGQRYSRTTFKDNGAAIFLNEDGSRSIFCDLDD